MSNTVLVKPINGFVMGENGAYLKQKQQEVMRTPHMLRLLRIGDLVEVQKPVKTEKPTPKAAAKPSTDKGAAK